MKRRLFVGLIMLTLLCVVLSACNVNTTTPTTPPGTTQLTLNDEGNIGVDGRGYFYYQKVLTLTATTTYHGVIFTLNTPGPGTTILAPIAYWFTITFADGSSEQIQEVGLGQVNNIDINITEHDNPSAGVLLVWQDIGGSLTPFLYLLVSE